jgi:hypothetical protein
MQAWVKEAKSWTVDGFAALYERDASERRIRNAGYMCGHLRRWLYPATADGGILIDRTNWRTKVGAFLETKLSPGEPQFEFD